MEKVYTKAELMSDIRNIGVKEGDLLHLKVSMRSLGKIEGGAGTLLDALLEVVGIDGTLVCDSFINTFPFPLKEPLEKYLVDDKTPTYAGAFAQTMVDHPANIRSKHPIQKFSAIGARAQELMLSHTADSFAYKPLRIMAEEGAKNLTIGKNVIGVGTTHVAVDIAGLTRKKPQAGVIYRDENGEMKRFRVNWNGGCGRGFPKFIPLYEKQGGLIKRAMIGNAESILTDMKKTLSIEIEKLKEEPAFFFCNDPTCRSCRLSWEHSNGSMFTYNLHLLKKKLRKHFKK